MLLVLHPKWLRADADRTVTKRKKRKLESWPNELAVTSVPSRNFSRKSEAFSQPEDQINLESGLGSSDESAEEHEDESGMLQLDAVHKSDSGERVWEGRRARDPIPLRSSTATTGALLRALVWTHSLIGQGPHN